MPNAKKIYLFRLKGFSDADLNIAPNLSKKIRGIKDCKLGFCSDTRESVQKEKSVQHFIFICFDNFVIYFRAFF